MRTEIVFSALGLAFGALLALFGAPIVVALFLPALFALVLPFVLIVFGLPVLVHELGHFVVARRFGIQILGFNVLGIALIRDAPALPMPRDNLGYIQIRTTLAQDRAGVWVPYLAAGPLAGLAFVVVEGILWRLDPLGLGPLVGIQALLGLMLSIVSLLGRDRFPRRDGEKMRDVRKPDSQTFALTSYVRVAQALERGEVLGCDPEDLRRALNLHDPFLLAHATGIACYRALLKGVGAVEAARTYLLACDAALVAPIEEKQRAQIAVLRRDAVFELAFAQSLEGHDAQAEATLSLLDRVEPTDFHNALRVDAALARARGDEEETRRRIARARAHLDRQHETNPNPIWDLAERFLVLVEPPTK